MSILFYRGMQYKFIVEFLSKYHNVQMSVRTLKRRLRKMGLKRKGIQSVDDSAYSLISKELEKSSGISGYRAICHRLKTSFNIHVTRDNVMRIVREIYPVKSRERKARKLKRRIYTSPGPNAV